MSHADGTIIVYDKERDDGVFLPQEPTHISAPDLIAVPNPTLQDNALPRQRNDWNPMERILVTMPPWHPGTSGAGLTSPGGKGEKERIAKNPVSHWRVSGRSVLGQPFFGLSKFINQIKQSYFFRFHFLSGCEICSRDLRRRLP